MNAIFFAGSIIGMITDLVFLTNLYHRKYPIKLYWVMIGAMALIVNAEIFLLKDNYRVIIQILSYLIIICLFAKSFKSISYFSLSFTIMSLIEVFAFSTVKLSYDLVGLLTILVKIFFILTIFKEISKHDIKIAFNPITSKILCLLFSFLCLCISIYINIVWRC